MCSSKRVDNVSGVLSWAAPAASRTNKDDHPALFPGARRVHWTVQQNERPTSGWNTPLKDNKIDNALPWGRVRDTLGSPVLTLLPPKENDASWMPQVELAEMKVLTKRALDCVAAYTRLLPY